MTPSEPQPIRAGGIPLIDVGHLGSAITWADENAKPDGIDGNWWVRAIIAEYIRLSESSPVEEGAE